MKAFLLSSSLLFGVISAFAQDIDLLPRGQETIFKAMFNVQGTDMAGFLAAKHSNDGVLHVEFTTPMGNNLISMKWENNRWKQEYAVRQLKNRYIMELLGEDLKYVLGHYIYSDDFIDLCDEWFWGRMKLKPDFRKGKLHSLKVYTKQNKHDRTIIYSYQEEDVSEVVVEHPDMPYSLKLERIEKK